MGKVDGDFWSGTYVVLKNPAILVSTPEKGLGMAPWLMYTVAEKDGVQINVANIEWASEPRPEIVEQYTAQYGNGLLLPSKQIQSPAPELVISEA